MRSSEPAAVVAAAAAAVGIDRAGSTVVVVVAGRTRTDGLLLPLLRLCGVTPAAAAAATVPVVLGLLYGCTREML